MNKTIPKKLKVFNEIPIVFPVKFGKKNSRPTLIPPIDKLGNKLSR
jgi:hypothetical protein